MAEKQKTETAKALRIGLNPVKRFPLKMRARRAITFIRRFVTKNTRIPTDNVFVSNEINEAVWARGISNIPNKLDLDIQIEGKQARVFLKDGKEKTVFQQKKKENEQKKKKEEEKAKEEKTKEQKEQEKIEEQKKEEKKLKEENSKILDAKR